MSGSNNRPSGETGTRNLAPYTGAPGGPSVGTGYVPPGTKSPGAMKRLIQAVNYTISGISPSTWFSPMQPLQPMRVPVSFAASPASSRPARRLAIGLSNKIITGELNITERPIKVRVNDLLRKTRASNRTLLAIWALLQPNLVEGKPAGRAANARGAALPVYGAATAIQN